MTLAATAREGPGWDPSAEGAVDPFDGDLPRGWRAARPVAAGVRARDARFYDVIGRKGRAWFTDRQIVARVGRDCAVGPYATCLQIWRDYDARWPTPTDRADFDLRRGVRIRLDVEDEPEPDRVLLAYNGLFGRLGLTQYRVGQVLGYPLRNEHLRRARSLFGLAVPPAADGSGGSDMIGPAGGVRRLGRVKIDGRTADVRLFDAVGYGALRKLRETGAIGFEHGRYVVDPDATCREVWRAFEERILLDEEEAFARARRARRILDVLDMPWSDASLAAFVGLYGSRGVERVRVVSVFGEHSLDDAMPRLRAMVGLPAFPGARSRRGTAADVLALLPVRYRSAFERHLVRDRHPAPPKMDEKLAGRVASLPEGSCRLLCALGLVAVTADRRAYNTVQDVVRFGCRWTSLLEKVDVGDGSAIIAVQKAYLTTGLDTRATELTRTCDCAGWYRLMNLAIDCVRLVLKEDAEGLLDMLPAARRPDADLATLLAAEKKRLLGTKPIERLPVVADVISRLMAVQTAVENRLLQLERLMSACAKALPDARARLEAGLEAGFELDDVVVRADGTLGAGRQRTRFSFVLESTLLERAHEARPDDTLVNSRLPRVEGAAAALRYGDQHDAARWRRIHIVYDGTWSDDPDVEPVEPFFIEFFRYAAFDTCAALSDELRRRQLDLLDRLALPRSFRVPEGLLGHSREDRVLARLIRGDRYEAGAIMIPLVSFHHAMAMARIVVRYGIRWGARLGEIMQMRLGCGGRHRRDGRWRSFLRLQPKGWETEGRFGIDDGTTALIARLRALSNRRWHEGRRDAKRKPFLPEVAYGGRRDLPDAAYLFQGPRRALTAGQLSLFTKVLLAGVVNMTSHDGRYVFATALGLRGEGYQTIGGLLHHRRGSPMPAAYDLSAALGAGDAAERFTDEVDAALLGRLADG